MSGVFFEANKTSTDKQNEQNFCLSTKSFLTEGRFALFPVIDMKSKFRLSFLYTSAISIRNIQVLSVTLDQKDINLKSNY